MIRVIVGAVVFCCLVCVQECAPSEGRDLADQDPTNTGAKLSAEDVRDSAATNYQLLPYVQENELSALSNCPNYKCFSDGSCIDLCDAGAWPQ